jgi:hypothetical protein
MMRRQEIKQIKIILSPMSLIIINLQLHISLEEHQYNLQQIFFWHLDKTAAS